MNKNLLFLLVISFITLSCSKEEKIISPELSEYNLSVINYFNEIALGFEFGFVSEITRRWENNMKIFVGGNPTSELLVELEGIISEINELSTTGFVTEIVTDSLQSNFYIFFGSDITYAALFPSQSILVTSNYGLFSVLWNNSNELNKGNMYVDIFRATPQEQQHLLREELTQSLGLAKDSPSYPESIFQQSFSTKTTEYAQIDRDLIRLLYHPDMSVGLNKNQVDQILEDILLGEQ